MTTLKEAIESLAVIITPKSKGKLAEELLGKYKSIIPRSMSSTSWIKKLRTNLYGKIK